MFEEFLFRTTSRLQNQALLTSYVSGRRQNDSIIPETLYKIYLLKIAQEERRCIATPFLYLSYQGKIENERTGKPDAFSGFGTILKMIAPLGGNLSRFFMSSI